MKRYCQTLELIDDPEIPRQAEWEAYVAKAQGADPSLPSAKKWRMMDKIFDMNK